MQDKPPARIIPFTFKGLRYPIRQFLNPLEMPDKEFFFIFVLINYKQ